MTAPNTPAETSDQAQQARQIRQTGGLRLITIGVFAALYFVMVCIATLVSTLFTGGFGSIFLPAITALISGCVYMLLAARLGKFGGIDRHGRDRSDCSCSSPGYFVLSFIASIVFPVAADSSRAPASIRARRYCSSATWCSPTGLTGRSLPYGS